MSDTNDATVPITTRRRRRGVVKASITRLVTKLEELETKVTEPSTLGHAQKMTQKLESLDSEFKGHHYVVVDSIADDEHVEANLAKEQDILDQHDSDVANLLVRLEQLVASCKANAESAPPRIAGRNLQHLRERLNIMSADISPISGEPEQAHLLEQYQEQLSDHKRELASIRQHILTTCTAEEATTLKTITNEIDKLLFDLSLSIRKRLSTGKPTTPTPTLEMSSSSVKLPKLDVPKFDGDVLHWQTFWEQFYVAIHSQADLPEAQKLAYLRQALKDGSAKSTIEGLSRSGEQYGEAVECLRARYDRPRLIHQAHVRKIIEAPSLKDGTGKELRRLHDTAQQHLRALKAMKKEPSAPFITSLLEMKLDPTTMFEWQRASQGSVDVPNYADLLEFLNLRAQASESLTPDTRRNQRNGNHPNKGISPQRSTSYNTVVENADSCALCKTDKHPLYTCPRFKSLPHDQMITTLRSNNLCMNCLRPGHYSRKCSSVNRCRKCQKPHHTLLHIDKEDLQAEKTFLVSTSESTATSHAATGFTSNTLLMTCQLIVHGPNGTTVRARALLDSASSTSFVSERLVNTMCLSRSSRTIRISGIAGLSHKSPLHSIANFTVSSTLSPKEQIPVSAIVVPRVTSDLPLQPVHPNAQWSHLTDLYLADPDFGCPGRIDVLLGVEVYADVLLHGRRTGPPGSPVAFETKFGWVLAGRTNTSTPSSRHVTSHHVSVASGDDILRKFWEIEESPRHDTNLSPEERSVVQHFKETRSRSASGRFIVPLPKRSQTKPLGESRTQAVRRFLSLERSLRSKNQFSEFSDVLEEYFKLEHAELVPPTDLRKPPEETFYLPMHAVRKEHSTTTKLRVVFDASAKSTSGVSLNDTLLVGPTVHPPLVDVLLRFRFHRVAITADVSKMYRAVELAPSDRDLHRFVWRRSPNDPLRDYRMTRVTFGVSASYFAANMSVKQNALDLATEYPQAANAVEKSFYVDNCLTGADSIPEAIRLQRQLQDLFAKGGFLLRKWHSSEQSALQHLSTELKDPCSMQMLPDSSEYTRTLGIEWNAKLDHFRLTIAELPPLDNITKRVLVSDIAKTFDVLGWFSPSVIKVKILLQQLWEQKVEWDDPVPSSIHDAWLQWRSELPLLSNKHISRCYFGKHTHIVTAELHGFCDASELAYAAVVYLRLADSNGDVQISLVTSKSKVAPIKRLTIPRLELCGAHLLAQLLYHVQQVFEIPLTGLHAWTDSTIVLNWLDGNPRRFKTYVGNRISMIMELIPPEKWNHVSGLENPADCASRGLFPSELLQYPLWWNGPAWLKKSPSEWPRQLPLSPNVFSDEEKEISLHTLTSCNSPILPLDRYSRFGKLRRVTAWTFRFIRNCRDKGGKDRLSSPLSARELQEAECYWMKIMQHSHFQDDIDMLKNQRPPNALSPLLSLSPFLDSSGLLRVGGRQQLSKSSYQSQHPIILSGKHSLTRLIIRTEHLRLLHAGPTQLMSSLSCRYHIVGGRKVVRSVTRKCVTCRRNAAKPQPQLLGQLPIERLTAGPVFDKTGVDYAGPVLIKLGHVRKPTVVKAYVCLFVSLTVKAVHLELVSDLTSDAFIASLRRFISRRGIPSLIWSDHGTNFVGAAREIKELFKLLRSHQVQDAIVSFLSEQGVTWKFIPQHAPHFGGLWEAAVKSMKTHLCRIVGNVKLTFEELTTVLTQIEACLNSRPLAPLLNDDDGIEALTPGHFLIGRPLVSLPDNSFTHTYSDSLSSLRRWQLCQALTRHFWKRWSTEYVTHLGRFTKWRHPSRNLAVGDIVILREDSILPTKWPLARVVSVHPGKDNLVRVVTIKTSTGTYTRPVTKVALLLPTD